MKKVKAILMAAVVGLFVSCTKSDLVQPIDLMDSPHKRDTTLNNYIPRIIDNDNRK